jgi:hypothetical protein
VGLSPYTPLQYTLCDVPYTPTTDVYCQPLMNCRLPCGCHCLPRWYPAAGAALFTGLYACLAGGLLLAAPQACFGERTHTHPGGPLACWLCTPLQPQHMGQQRSHDCNVLWG